MEQLTVWEDFGQAQCLSTVNVIIHLDGSFGFDYSGPEPEGTATQTIVVY